MTEFELRAYGKINLGLDVIGKRDDGYHLVKMIMQTVKLYDRLHFTQQEEGITLSTNMRFLPVNKDNLVYKACDLIIKEYGINSGVHVHIDKHIPVAAGMAGGSADAACALIAMNKMFQLKLDQDTLMKYGLMLGADVPYCIMRGTALSEGIGEVLTRLAPIPDCHILLAKPPVNVSTAAVYSKLDAAPITSNPDIDGMVAAIGERDLHGITTRMGNVLESVTLGMHPEIKEIEDIMMDCGAENAMMSGSGPTVFGIFRRSGDAFNAKCRIISKGLSKQVYNVKPFNIRLHK